jgi:hypothetical protein
VGGRGPSKFFDVLKSLSSSFNIQAINETMTKRQNKRYKNVSYLNRVTSFGCAYSTQRHCGKS